MFRQFVPVLACVALLVSGCGGDDDSTGGSASDAAAPKPLTKAEYLAQGNKVCKDTKQELDPLDDRADDLDRGDLPAAAKLLEEALEVARDGHDRLTALRPPAAEAAAVREYVTATGQLLDQREKILAPLRADDREAAAKVAEGDDSIDAKQDRLGDALGLDDCSNVF